MKTKNRILMADSYKYSHTTQYPPKTTSMYSYLEARGSKQYNRVVFFGLQYLLKTYFSTPITLDEVKEAKDYAEANGVPFDTEGWTYIATTLKGMLPVEIKAVQEGSVLPLSVPLLTVESTDPRVFWVASWLETFLMKVWYPCTVATRSYFIKQLLLEFANKTQDIPNVDFQFHNFGYRGATTEEAGVVGGMAHLTQFLGTDNIYSLKTMAEAYNAHPSTIGYSIPATEHSTVTSWGRDGEEAMMMNYLEQNKGKHLIACVMDSYDYYSAITMITSGKFKQKIESSEYPTFVIRPDSGEQVEILHFTLSILEKNKVAYTTNGKGFKVLNKYRIIFGDGINEAVINQLLNVLYTRGYSSENIAFGSGGWLMQDLNRDTLGFAIKCSSITIDGKQKDVYKDPKTDSSKKSKRGRVTTWYETMYKKHIIVDVIGDTPSVGHTCYLDRVFLNGKIICETTLSTIRANSNE